MGFKTDLLTEGQPVSTDNRLPVTTDLAQPLTSAQLQSARVQIEDTTGQIPHQIRFPERTYSATLHAGNLVYTWDMARFSSFSLQLNNNGATAATSFLLQGSNDGVTWHNYAGHEFIAGFKQTLPSLPAQFVMSGLGSILVGGPKNFRFGRITMSAVTYYPHTLTLYLSSVPFVPRRSDVLSNPEAYWSYSSGTSTLSVATPTVIQASQGPPFRQVMTSLKLTNAGTADTEFIVQNGGSETLYANIATASILHCDTIKAGEKISLDMPFIASGGNALRFWMKTQTSVNLYLNCRGVLINA